MSASLLGGDGEVDSEVYEVHWHEVVVDISFVWDSLTKLMFLWQYALVSLYNAAKLSHLVAIWTFFRLWGPPAYQTSNSRSLSHS
jgi:hypothetical protein